MTFRFTVKQNPLQIEFEAGSIAEAIGILTDSQTALGTIFAQIAGICGNTPAEALTVNNETEELTAEQIAANAEAKTLNAGKRGRPSLTDRQKAANAAAKAARAPNPLPPSVVAASAPAPLPIPGAPPTATVDTRENAAGVPAFLDRSAPPPPPAPIAPPAPPVSPLADAIIANLKMRKGQTADNGAALMTWLVSAGVVANGASFEEAVAVLQFTTADKLAPIATALGVK